MVFYGIGLANRQSAIGNEDRPFRDTIVLRNLKFDLVEDLAQLTRE